MTAPGEPLYGNWRKRDRVVGGQTVVSMCAANQWNVVCQSNYAFGWIFRRWLRQNVRNSTLRQLWGTHYTETVKEDGPGGGWAGCGVHAVRR